MTRKKKRNTIPEFPEPKIFLSDRLICQHNKRITNCRPCLDMKFTDIKCEHQLDTFLCEQCFTLIYYYDEDDGTTRIPYIAISLGDFSPQNLEFIKNEREPIYNYLETHFPLFFPTPTPVPPLDDTSAPSTSAATLASENSTADTLLEQEKNLMSSLEVQKVPRKFNFSKNCKCQHNEKVFLCSLCHPKNLNDIKNIKCLHLIPIIECNHCKNLITILKKESEKIALKLISDKDYIPLSEYDKLYPFINPNRKKNSINEDKINDNNKKRKIEKNTDNTVSNEKNPRNKPENQDNKNTETLNEIGTNNKRNFRVLETEEMEIESKNAQTTEEQIITSEKETKPPPIFVLNENLISLREILTGYEIEYSSKKLLNDQIKLTFKNESEYRKTLQKLHDLEIKFYTFKPSCGKVVKRIIRGLPINYEPEKIKSNIEELKLGLKVRNIRQIYHKINKQPLPLFEISFLAQVKCTEKLEKIEKLDNFAINFEKFNPKYIEIPLCKSCLSYGHTKRYCSVGIICIICNGPHFSTQCPESIKAKEENTKVIPKCLHCSESHFTTWKGCKFYKQLKKARLEKIKKQSDRYNDNEKEGRENIQLKQVNEQIKNLELKFEKEISLLNKIIDALKNEVSKLNSKLKSIK